MGREARGKSAAVFRAFEENSKVLFDDKDREIGAISGRRISSMVIRTGPWR